MNKIAVAIAFLFIANGAYAQGRKSLKDIDKELKQTKSTATAMALIESIAETVPQTEEDVAILGRLIDNHPDQGRKALANIKDPRLAKAIMRECDRQILKFKADKDKDWKTLPETQRREKLTALLNTQAMILTLGNLKNKEALPYLKQYIAPEYDGVLSYAASQAIGQVAPDDPAVFKELWEKQGVKSISYNAYGKSVLKEVAQKMQDPNLSEAEKKKIFNKGHIWGLGGRTAEEKALIKDILLNHPSRDLRAEAATAMVHAVINNPEEGDKAFVIQWAKNEKTVAVYDAPAIMDKIWDKRFVPILIEMLNNQADWMPRKAVAELLGRRQIKASLPFLEECIEKDKNGNVRGECQDAYWKIAGKIPSIFHPDDVKEIDERYNNPAYIKLYAKSKKDDPWTQKRLAIQEALKEFKQSHPAQGRSK